MRRGDDESAQEGSQDTTRSIWETPEPIILFEQVSSEYLNAFLRQLPRADEWDSAITTTESDLLSFWLEGIGKSTRNKSHSVIGPGID